MITIFEKVAEDVAKFLLIYIFVFLPFCFSFWIMFGGASIEAFGTMDKLMFTVFRMFVVDDYPFDEMHSHDFVMTYLFVGMNFLICAIIFMNLMIALLSDSFQRIYDNAHSVALLQQADSIMGMELYNLDKDKLLEFAELLAVQGDGAGTGTEDLRIIFVLFEV